jgi:hypothetical protein
VAKIQTSTSKGCRFVRFVGITRSVPIILKPKLALSKGHQSSGMASNRTFEARQPRVSARKDKDHNETDDRSCVASLKGG